MQKLKIVILYDCGCDFFVITLISTCAMWLYFHSHHNLWQNVHAPTLWGMKSICRFKWHRLMVLFFCLSHFVRILPQFSDVFLQPQIIHSRFPLRVVITVSTLNLHVKAGNDNVSAPHIPVRSVGRKKNWATNRSRSRKPYSEFLDSVKLFKFNEIQTIFGYKYINLTLYKSISYIT